MKNHPRRHRNQRFFGYICITQNHTDIKMTKTFTLDMIQSAGVGVLALLLGMIMTRKISWLQKFCIPSPVSGGIVFSLISLAVYMAWDAEISFDGTLKDIFMLAFFTSVGFQSNMKAIRQGGRTLVMMLLLLVVVIALQNLMPLGITRLLGVDPLVGMAAGSIPMAGGHGTAGGFSSLLESMGLEGAGTLSMAAATFGLVSGSMIGGPIAERLIRKKLLTEHREAKDFKIDPATAGVESSETLPDGQVKRTSTQDSEFHRYANATYTLIITMAIGTVASVLLGKTGITFPTYFGALVTAAVARNVLELTPLRKHLEMEKIISLGNISLSIFLGMAMVSLKLWELQSLALPLILILTAQVAMMALITYYVAFPLLGKDYDAAVLVAGICGFGLGATPNAMANMSAVCYKYRYSVKPFLIVPIVGAMFVDMINTGIITLFLNWIK